MTTEERQALSHAHRPWVKGLWAMVIAIGIIILTLAVLLPRHPGKLEHLLGLSTERTATVTQIDRVAFCARSHTDTFTLEWDEDGRHRSETVGRCGDPWKIGDRVHIWSTSGEPQTSPPIVLRLFVGIVVLAIALVVIWMMRGRRRVLRSTTAALDGTWRPLTLPTSGSPGAFDFRVESEEPVRTVHRDWVRVIHAGPGSLAASRQEPGTLYIDAIHRGRPRGLSLHTTASGARVWRWHG